MATWDFSYWNIPGFEVDRRESGPQPPPKIKQTTLNRSRVPGESQDRLCMQETWVSFPPSHHNPSRTIGNHHQTQKQEHPLNIAGYGPNTEQKKRKNTLVHQTGPVKVAQPASHANFCLEDNHIEGKALEGGGPWPALCWSLALGTLIESSI